MCEGGLERSSTHPPYPIMGGRLRTLRQPAGTLMEVGLGTLGQAAVFDCRPSALGRGGQRVVVQTRTDVTLRMSLHSGRTGVFPGNVALGAFSDPDDAPLTWVQTGRFVPEHVISFDGREETRALTRPVTYDGESTQSIEPLRDPMNNEPFIDRAQQWWIDSPSASARYADAGAYLQPSWYANGEIIYDGPSQSVRYADYFRENPDVRRVRASIEFKTYLYRRPGHVRGFPAARPLVMVEWWFREDLERPAPGARWEVRGAYAEILWIIPNPTEPVSLDAAIARYPRL